MFYLTFDNEEVGRMQAREVFKVKPEGNYVFIKGSGADPNADFLFAGSMEVLKDAIDSGKIKNVGEAYTDGWLPANAQRNMEQFLTANDNKVDAVVAANDGTAGGAIAALTAQGLAGSRAGIRPGRRPRRAEPRRARHPDRVGLEGRARTRQERGRDRLATRRRHRHGQDRGRGEVQNAGPESETNSLFLTPVAITKDNLNVVIDAGWITKDEVCEGVKAGSVTACD